MYVCMYEHMYVRMYVHTYVRIHVCMYLYHQLSGIDIEECCGIQSTTPIRDI